MSQPLVGIAMAAYKPNVEFFRAQLQSIVDQTYTNWFSHISFDSPIAEIRDELTLAPFFADKRFTFFQNTGTPGVVGNFETCGVACLSLNPKYVAYSDQDDIWYPRKIELLVERLEQLPSLSVVHCDMNILMKRPDGTFENGEQTAWRLERRGVNNVSPLDFFIRNIAAGAGMLMDANLIRRYPKIPGEVYGQDHWYPMIASFFGKVSPLNQPLYGYRIHGENVSGIGEYRGFFAASRSSAKEGVLKKCMLAFNSSRARYLRARDANLPVTWIHSLITNSIGDLGLAYLLKGISVYATDRALARACLARAAGKVASIFNSSFREETRH